VRRLCSLLRDLRWRLRNLAARRHEHRQPALDPGRSGRPAVRRAHARGHAGAAGLAAPSHFLGHLPRVRTGAPRLLRRCRRGSADSLRAARGSRRAIRNRSNAPDTCQQSSIAHTRSRSSARAQHSSLPKLPSRAAAVNSPRAAAENASTAPQACVRLCVRPDHDHFASSLRRCQGRLRIDPVAPV
jgi:hypothetical protein